MIMQVAVKEIWLYKSAIFAEESWSPALRLKKKRLEDQSKLVALQP